MRLVLTLFFALHLFGVELSKPVVYNNQNIIGYFASEKLDGIRAYWDGKHLYTRKGVVIQAPLWFTEHFPPFELDGELYTQRSDFSTIQSIVMDDEPSNEWRKIRYHIFEVPHAKGGLLERLDSAKKWFLDNPSDCVAIITQTKITTQKQFQSMYQSVVENGGEGLIVRDGKELYKEGRNPKILKVKAFSDDEAVVIKQNLRPNGELKSLQVRYKEVEFDLGGGFSDFIRRHPPKAGEVVSFKYQTLSKKGIPIHASFLRVRKD